MVHPLVSVLIVSYCLPRMTRDCVLSVLKHTENCEVLIYDQASDKKTVLMLQEMERTYHRVHVTYATTNTGYIGGNNALVKQAQGEYICVLNNDVVVGQDWMGAHVRELQADPKLAIVGPRGLYGFISADFTGVPGPANQEQEYICGWCLTIPRWVYERFGLFAEDLKMGFCEDADFSLRVRSAGYKIKTLRGLAIQHLGHQSYKAVEGNEVKRTHDHKALESQNRETCKARWGRYLACRTFVESVIILKRRGAAGDVLCCEPAIREVRRQNPKAFIAFQTACPAVIGDHPALDAVWSHDGVRGADRTIVLDDVYERNPKRHMVATYLDAVGAAPGTPSVPVFHVQPKDAAWAKRVIPDNSPPALIVCPEGQWRTRLWPLERFMLVSQAVQRISCIRIIEVGQSPHLYMGVGEDMIGATTVGRLAALIQRAAGVLCNDQLVWHLATAVGTPQVVIFGCAAPQYRVHDPRLTTAMWRDDIDCHGCHHEPPAPRYFTSCKRGSPACLMLITVDAVVKAVDEMLKRRLGR